VVNRVPAYLAGVEAGRVIHLSDVIKNFLLEDEAKVKDMGPKDEDKDMGPKTKPRT